MQHAPSAHPGAHPVARLLTLPGQTPASLGSGNSTAFRLPCLPAAPPPPSCITLTKPPAAIYASENPGSVYSKSVTCFSLRRRAFRALRLSKLGCGIGLRPQTPTIWCALCRRPRPLHSPRTRHPPRFSETCIDRASIATAGAAIRGPGDAAASSWSLTAGPGRHPRLSQACTRSPGQALSLSIFL